MLPIDKDKPQPHRPIRKILLSLAVALIFELASLNLVLADVTDSTALDASMPPNLGSIGEYAQDTGSPESEIASYFPLVGICVFSGIGKLASGQVLSGLVVTSVDKWGIGYAGGIRGEHLQMARASAQLGMIVLVVGATAVFPPAMLGLPLLAKLPSPKSSDVIVAVDAERIRDVSEFANYLRHTKAGEILYLTIIRDGRRVQLRVPIAEVESSRAPVLPK